MKENYQEALDRLLEHEGGYSNDVGDPGGPTKYGITIHDVRMYINPNATARDVRNLTLDQAKEIYRTKYWAKVKGNQLPSGVDYVVFDYGINSGTVRAARVLQRIVGVEQDGKIGPITLAATANKNPAELINAISDERLHFLQGLKTWKLFGKGWGRRVREVRAAALAMVKKAQQEEKYPAAG